MCFSANTNVVFPSQMDVAYDNMRPPSFGIATDVLSVMVQAPEARLQAAEECVLPTWHCYRCCYLP